MATVKQLIALLKQFNPKDRVLLSSDEEGNSFGNLSLEYGYDDDNKALILYPEDSELDIADLF